MKRVIETITCDRCGKEITGDPVRIVPHHVERQSESEADEPDEGRKKLPLWTVRMMDQDFCEECAAEIVAFALNRNACDECVDEIVDEIHHSVNEKTVDETGDPEKIPDVESVDWNAALDRIEQAKEPDGNAAESQETVLGQLEGGEGSEENAALGVKKQTGRKKLDHGKIMALHSAGWTNAQIAEEMGTSKGTIAATICTLKKGQQGDA